MPATIFIKSKNHVVEKQRHAAAQRVIDAYGNKLPEARLLCFFDDQDWRKYKQGMATRGLYWPVDDDLWDCSPEYVKKQLVMSGPRGLSVRAFDHFIYLH